LDPLERFCSSLTQGCQIATDKSSPISTSWFKKLALTQREAEVLLPIARGKSSRNIAEILALGPRTVNKHLEQIYASLIIYLHRQ
jgi:DNA-binding CsgD family transcriptional regulator